MFVNTNRQLLHENSSVQLQFNQIQSIWNHWIVLCLDWNYYWICHSPNTGLDCHTSSAMCHHPLSTFSLRHWFSVCYKVDLEFDSQHCSLVQQPQAWTQLACQFSGLLFQKCPIFHFLHLERYWRVFYARINLPSHFNSWLKPLNKPTQSRPIMLSLLMVPHIGHQYSRFTLPVFRHHVK